MEDTHYVLGSCHGTASRSRPIVRDFQAVISKEIKQQMLEKEGKLPDAVLACVGGGSNAIGAFYHFIEDKEVQLIGCEAAGRGVNTAGDCGDDRHRQARHFPWNEVIFLPG